MASGSVPGGRALAQSNNNVELISLWLLHPAARDVRTTRRESRALTAKVRKHTALPSICPRLLNSLRAALPAMLMLFFRSQSAGGRNEVDAQGA